METKNILDCIQKQKQKSTLAFFLPVLLLNNEFFQDNYHIEKYNPYIQM